LFNFVQVTWSDITRYIYICFKVFEHVIINKWIAFGTSLLINGLHLWLLQHHTNTSRRDNLFSHIRHTLFSYRSQQFVYLRTESDMIFPCAISKIAGLPVSGLLLLDDRFQRCSTYMCPDAIINKFDQKAYLNTGHYFALQLEYCIWRQCNADKMNLAISTTNYPTLYR